MSGEAERSRNVAIDLMRMALALLERSGEPLAAARLQHAVDAALQGLDVDAGSPHPAD